MERFVFVFAVTVALVFGLFHLLGGPSWSFDIDNFEGGRTDPVIEVAAGRFEPQTYQAASIDVEYAAARVLVTPEDRTDIVVEIDNPGSLPMPEMRLEGGELTIDGRLRGRVHDCQADGVDVRGYGVISAENMPRIIIRTPRDVSIEVGGASNAEIGASQSLDASFSGCGGAQVADVTDTLRIDLAGSGLIRTGAARSLDVDLAGSGEIEAGAIAEGADLDVAGSGGVTILNLTGPLSMDAAGSGSLNVGAGAITDANVDLAGSGGVDITGSVQHLIVSIVGSGDVEINGAVGDIDADIAGSGGVRADAVTGAVRKEIWGSGEVRVGT